MKQVIERFRSNSHGFWSAHRWLMMAFILALFCDAASTVYFMLHVGPEAELHPAVRIISHILGPVAGPLLSASFKAIAGVCVAIYLRRFARHIFFTVAVISFWAAWYNMWGNAVYTPLFMKWLVF